MSFLFGGSKPKVIPEFTGLQVNTSVQVLPIAIGYGQPRTNLNLIYYNGFQAKIVKMSSGGKALLSGGKNANEQVEYFATIIMAIGEGPLDLSGASPISIIYQDQAVYEIADYPTNGTFVFNGTDTQLPWSYVQATWPADARSYKDTAYMAFPNAQLDSSATVPQISVVCRFPLVSTSPLNDSTITITTGNYDSNGNPISFIGNIHIGTADADPAQVIVDVLTNPRYGAGFPPALLDSAPGASIISGANAPLPGLGDAAVGTYCQAVGFAFSVLLNNVESTSSILDRWCKNMAIAPCWTGELLKFIPYWDSYNGDNPGWVAGQGPTSGVNPYNVPMLYFNPNVTPLVTLTVDHLLQAEQQSDDPITFSRVDPMEVYNTIRIDYKDRTNFFNDNVAEAKDEANIELIGPRIDNIGLADEFTLQTYAQAAATVQLRRAQAVRRSFTFRLGPLWAIFDQMDLVQIPDPENYASYITVRIVSMEDDEHEITTYTAEEFPLGALSPLYLPGSPTTPPNQGGTNLGFPDVTPAPIIFEPTSAMVTAQGLSTGQIIVGATSAPGDILNPNWGGAFIWVSLDGVNYEQVGTLRQPSTMGVLTQALLPPPGGGNPDHANTLTVDMSMSQTLMPTVSDAAAALGKNLCFVQDLAGWELLSYSVATLIGPNSYTFALTDLYRSLYGTTGRMFGAGSQFLFVDATGNFFETAMPAQYIGQTLYVKFQSFNVFNNGTESLGVAPVFTYKVTGGGPGPVPPFPTPGMGGLQRRRRGIIGADEDEQVRDWTRLRGR